MTYKNAKPFIKWAGGKSQILDSIRQKYPACIRKYCEPFVGGGAVLFDVLVNYHPLETMIIDTNLELINTYRQIQNNVEELICFLQEYQNVFWKSDTEKRKEIFLTNRNKFNELKLMPDEKNEIERASLFIFLNKTCFNGLYRVNRKGLFNVPIGSYKKPLICDTDNLCKISKLLQGVRIQCGDYSECYDFIDEQTFVYIDPPYRPLTATANFTAYSDQGFDDKEQIKLARFVDRICRKGVSVLISNSDPKNIDENDTFFDDLYQQYKIERISAKRMINCKGNCRGIINELLIYNSEIRR